MTGRLRPRRYAAEKTHRDTRNDGTWEVGTRGREAPLTPGCVSGGEAPGQDTTVLVEVFREPQLWLNYPAPFSGSHSRRNDAQRLARGITDDGDL